jgi:hypothetical protein
MFVLKVLPHSSLLMSSRFFPAHLKRGIANQDVQTPEFRHGFTNELLANRFFGQVTRIQQRPTLRFRDPAGSVLGIVLLFKVHNRDVRALARKRDGHRFADAAVRAGDQRDAAHELARSAIDFLAVIGFRVESGFAPRRLLVLPF